MPDFDAIVVGSGCAGAIAAYEIAKEGNSVLVIERGEYSGSKNMTGGRIYSHSLKKVFPNFEEEAPLERRITQERISLTTSTSNFSIQFSSEDMLQEGKDSYSVLRGPFDQWLAAQAEEAGALYINGIAVEELIKDENGRVIGVRAGEDELTAGVVVLCDGVNSLLLEDAVGYKKPPSSAVAVGIKQTYMLSEETITNRILANSDKEGAAWMVAGDATKGKFGGGFMYTNKESISLGLVVGIDAVANGEIPVYQMMEDYKNAIGIKPLIEGGELVEHSGHMVPEGGYNIMPDLVGDGVLIAGESAMMAINLGYSVRGMDYAIAAGEMAGKVVNKAIEEKDFSKASLQRYVQMLEESFVLKDLKSFANAPEFLGNFDRMFNEYPEMLKDIMNGLFIVDGSPTKHVKEIVKPAIKKVGIFNILKDVKGAMKAL